MTLTPTPIPRALMAGQSTVPGDCYYVPLYIVDADTITSATLALYDAGLHYIQLLPCPPSGDFPELPMEATTFLPLEVLSTLRATHPNL